jgi:hypothetical protein
MPSPNKNRTSHEILEDKQELSLADWVDLLEARRRLIKPHLKSMQLHDLDRGSLLETRDGGFHSLFEDRPRLVKGSLPLGTPGIFGSNQGYSEHLTDIPGGRIYRWYAWALSRTGHWLLATTDVRSIKIRGRRERFEEKALRVEIRRAEIAELLERSHCTPENVLKVLGKSVNEWYAHRLELVRPALKAALVVQQDEYLLSRIPQTAR